MKLCKSSRSESFTSDLGEFCEARVTGCRPLALDGARASIPRSGLDLDSSIPREGVSAESRFSRFFDFYTSSVAWSGNRGRKIRKDLDIGSSVRPRLGGLHYSLRRRRRIQVARLPRNSICAVSTELHRVCTVSLFSLTLSPQLNGFQSFSFH